MKQLCRIIVLCALLIIFGKGYVKATSQDGDLTYTINEGASIILHASSGNASAYQWYKDGVKIDGALSKDYTATAAGMYSVVAYNGDGCSSEISDAVKIIVKPTDPPPANLPDTVVDLAVTITSSNTHAAPGDSFTYVLTADNKSPFTGTNIKVSYVIPENLVYLPQPNNPDIKYDIATRTLTWVIDQIKENDPTRLVITVKVLAPGMVESIVKIKGEQIDPVLANNVDKTVQQVYPLVIANVFTPNGDGVNDTFVVPGLETYSDTELTILNRWGNVVYQKTNYKNDWDGSGLAEGTYFYVLRAKNKAGVWDTYKGYLTLLRTRI